MSPRAYNFINAANKARRMLFFWNYPSRPLPPEFSSSFTRFLSGHALNMLLKHPLPSYPATQRHWKRCRSSLWSSWKASSFGIHFKIAHWVEEFLRSRAFRAKSCNHLRKKLFASGFCAWTPSVPDIHRFPGRLNDLHSFVLGRRCKDHRFKKTATRAEVTNSTSTLLVS